MHNFLQRLKQNHDAYGYRGILFAMKSRVLPPFSEVKVQPPCCSTPVLLRTRSSDVATYHQIFIKTGYDVDLAVTPQTIIDAGANVGFTSVYFAQKYPQANILAIEPESANFKLMRKNTRPYPTIVPVKAALWNTNAEIVIADPGVGTWGFRTHAQIETHHGAYAGKAPGVTVDRLITDYNLEFIDILKIDIEGAEKEVFENVTKWIHKIGVIMIELHERIKPGCTHTVMRATAGFDYKYENGETLFLARKNYIAGKSLSTDWRAQIPSL